VDRKQSSRKYRERGTKKCLKKSEMGTKPWEPAEAGAFVPISNFYEKLPNTLKNGNKKRGSGMSWKRKNQ
jgi:hypothetical protein